MGSHIRAVIAAAWCCAVASTAREYVRDAALTIDYDGVAVSLNYEGWVDLDDPDCDDGGTEEVGFGPHECNDGIDNEIDGLSPSTGPIGPTEDDDTADGAVRSAAL